METTEKGGNIYRHPKYLRDMKCVWNMEEDRGDTALINADTTTEQHEYLKVQSGVSCKDVNVKGTELAMRALGIPFTWDNTPFASRTMDNFLRIFGGG